MYNGSCSGSEMTGGEEIVTTLYINGFPDDFKDREFQNLFAFAKGFEGCSLRIPSVESDLINSPLLKYCMGNVPRGQILGFAKFKTLEDTLEACKVLTGRVIDIERGLMLKVELAKKNLLVSQLRSVRPVVPSSTAPLSSDGSVFGPNLTRRSSVPNAFYSSNTTTPTTPTATVTAAVTPTPTVVAPIATVPAAESFNGTSQRSLSIAIPGNPNPISITAPREQSYVLYDTARPGSNLLNKSQSTITGMSPPTMMAGPLASNNNVQLFAENPPCNTLYVGNLPPLASESELRSIFSAMPGFRRMSFRTKLGGTPMCFVEFEDIRSATYAMEGLYGTMLSNSTKGGIRLSYSKNPLGVRSGPPPSSYIGNSLYFDLFSPNIDLASFSAAASVGNDLLMMKDLSSGSSTDMAKIHESLNVDTRTALHAAVVTCSNSGAM